MSAKMSASFRSARRSVPSVERTIVRSGGRGAAGAGIAGIVAGAGAGMASIVGRGSGGSVGDSSVWPDMKYSRIVGITDT